MSKNFLPTTLHYQPLPPHTHTHRNTTTHHQSSSLPREIIQCLIMLLRAQTHSNGEEFSPVSVPCLFYGLLLLSSPYMCWVPGTPSWPNLLPTLHASLSSQGFHSHLFAHTSQILGSRQDLSPELQVLHYQLLSLPWVPQFMHWVVRSSRMSVMPHLLSRLALQEAFHIFLISK